MSSIAAPTAPLPRRAGLAGPGLDFIGDILLILGAWIAAGTVAGSHWVPGSDVVLNVAVVGMVAALVLARVSPRGLTFWLATEVSLVAVLFVSTAHFAGNPTADFVRWIIAIEHDLNLALLVSMVIGAWVLTAWLAYWAIRRGNVALGLVPMVLVMTVEVIDDPGQHGLTVLVLAWMVVAVLALMRHTVARLTRRWGSAEGPELPARVGIQGSRTLLLLIVAAAIIPPLTTVDLSTGYFNTSTSQGPGGHGSASNRQGTSPSFAQTGYSERVEPGGTLTRSLTPVMEVTSDFQRPVYWRGIDLYAVSRGAWEVGNSGTALAGLGPNQPVPPEAYLARRTVHATVKVLGTAQNTIFWPGDPVRTSIASQVLGESSSSSSGLGSVDGVYARNPVATNATYSVEATVSVATETQLRGAGTDYPPNVRLITNRLASNQPAPPDIDERVIALAQQVTAAQSTVYDKVKAIQDYLRSHYRYQLQVIPPPRGGDPDVYFLLSTKVGYCEYFASSMGEMVRSLGIPVRLADGYGPGSLEAVGERPPGPRGLPSLVRASDAHTWVEVFFPTYGWVPFEPTPDPLYPPLDRSAVDTLVTAPGFVAPPAAQQAPPRVPAPRPASGVVIGLGIAAVVVLVLLLAGLVGAVVVRGPRRVSMGVGSQDAVWRRLGWLAARHGQRRSPTDTPVEFAGRLAREMPSLGTAITDLGRAQSQWCYRRGGIAESQRRRAEDAWRRVRGAMVRELIWPTRREAVG